MKKTTKKVIVVLTCILLLPIIIYGSVGIFGDFYTKSAGCRGGFLSDFYRANVDSITEIADEVLDSDELAQIKFNMSIDKKDSRKISTKFVNETGEEVQLSCSMSGWYWSDSYKWEKV